MSRILHACANYYRDILDTREQNTIDFSDEEIKKAVFSLAKGKAVGPDGFPSEFYQIYWDIIGQDIINLVKALQDNKLDL